MERINVNSKRIIWIVLDSAGIGPMPDSAEYGDFQPNTLEHIAEKLPGFSLPVLEKLGLGHIDGVTAFRKTAEPIGAFAKMAEKSRGKDTTIGHWEMAGLYIDRPFPTYPNGFPPEIISDFERLTGRKVIGNYPASGLAIINDLGAEHVRTGDLIVYTSADSVFQIAAHEEIVPIAELYRYCEAARNILKGDHAVARVIARPFIGEAGNFQRTANRRDFSLKPPRPTILNHLKDAGHHVAAIGKIEDIFSGEGVSWAVHNQSNADGMQHINEAMALFENGLIFANLVDFDMKYGHRRDVQGYANALIEFDQWLETFLPTMKKNDLLIITADHGCDPTHAGTDHTREYVPLLMYGESIPAGKNFGVRATFADIAQTIAKIFGVSATESGESLL